MAHEISVIIDGITYDRVMPKFHELMCDECDLSHLCEDSVASVCLTLEEIDGKEIFKKKIIKHSVNTF
jgi:hypothetical protein